jgi:hypothetical protein
MRDLHVKLEFYQRNWAAKKVQVSLFRDVEQKSTGCEEASKQASTGCQESAGEVFRSQAEISGLVLSLMLS